MKSVPDERLKQARIKTGLLASNNSYGNAGAFIIKGPCGTKLRIIASDGEGWEHVSVSCEKRCPSWSEMQFAKELFWNDEETVIQFHPPKSQYVNICRFCLHLWKPIGIELPLPPTILIGPKGVEL